MQRVELEQMHVAIEPAEDREVAAERLDILGVRVVHADGENVVLARVQQRRDVEAEGGEVAAMLAGWFAVDEDLRDRCCAIEAEKDPLLEIARGDSQCAAIPTGAAVIVIAAV